MSRKSATEKMSSCATKKSTASLLGTAVDILATNADLQRRVRDNPNLLGAFIEETLRVDPPIQCTYRRTTAAVTLHTLDIEQGRMVVPMWGAAV